MVDDDAREIGEEIIRDDIGGAHIHERFGKGATNSSDDVSSLVSQAEKYLAADYASWRFVIGLNREMHDQGRQLSGHQLDLTGTTKVLFDALETMRPGLVGSLTFRDVPSRYAPHVKVRVANVPLYVTTKIAEGYEVDSCFSLQGLIDFYGEGIESSVGTAQGNFSKQYVATDEFFNAFNRTVGKEWMIKIKFNFFEGGSEHPMRGGNLLMYSTSNEKQGAVPIPFDDSHTIQQALQNVAEAYRKSEFYLPPSVREA